MSKAVRPILAALSAGLLLSSCGAGESQTPSGQASGPSSKEPSSSQASASPSHAPPSSSAPAKPKPVVVLDPGHNGGNAAHPEQINRKVPAGRGTSKSCNTTGTASESGYPEHAFTWALAGLVKQRLTKAGVRVVLTRNSDDGVGPCVNERAEVGNKANAAAVVSLHADGSTSAKAHGFHVSYPSPPLNAAQGKPSSALAAKVRDAMSGAGIATSSYLGEDGIYPREDLGGLNLSTRPAILLECGNMRNATDVAAFTSAAGKARYADAVTKGILSSLG